MGLAAGQRPGAVRDRPAETPPRLKRLIARCLDRDLKTRLRDIGEARVKIARLEAGGPDDALAPSTAASASVLAGPQVLPWAIAFVLGLVALWPWAPWRTVKAPPEMRVDIVTPATDQPASFALSPDGGQIVFVASGDGENRQYDLAPDGRFLINTVLESATAPITLPMNWNGAVKK